MFRKLYWTTRDRNYKSSMTLKDISLNGWYTTEFFNWGQFRDYEEAGITKLTQPIPNDRFTWTIPVIDSNEQPTGATVPKLTRFVLLEYSDIYTNATDLSNSITSSSSDTAVNLFDTPAETITWIKANTDLIEVTPWTFEITPAWNDLMWNPTEANLLIID